MNEETTIAYLIVVNIHDVKVVVNFNSILPEFPESGNVVIATSLGQQEPLTEKE